MDSILLATISCGLIFIFIIVFLIRGIIKILAMPSGKKEIEKSENNIKVDSYEAQKLKMEARDNKIDSWGELIKILVISGICGVIGYFIGTVAEEPELWAVFGICFPWGYSVIGRIIDDWVELYAFLASGWLWLIMFAIKIFLSITLGAIIMPIKLIISIGHIIQAHNLSNEVDAITSNNVKSENVVKVDNKENVEKAVLEESKKSKNLDDDVFRKLRELKQLRDENIISEEEYENKKKELLVKI